MYRLSKDIKYHHHGIFYISQITYKSFAYIMSFLISSSHKKTSDIKWCRWLCYFTSERNLTKVRSYLSITVYKHPGNWICKRW